MQSQWGLGPGPGQGRFNQCSNHWSLRRLGPPRGNRLDPTCFQAGLGQAPTLAPREKPDTPIYSGLPTQVGGPWGSFGRRQPRPCIPCDGPGLGERGRPGPLPFLTSRPHSLILESLPSTQPRLSWHLNPLDGGWVGEFLLFRKVTCLTRLSTHHYNPLSLPGMGLCFLTRLPLLSFVSTLLQPGQALDAAHLGRLFTLWLSLKTGRCCLHLGSVSSP